jgi:hypothetical protein
VGTSARQTRLAVEAWLDQYERRFLVRRPVEVDTIRHEIGGMSDRQIETFADWLRAKGATVAPVEEAGAGLRGFGLPRYPEVEPEGHPERMTLFGQAASSFGGIRRVARQSVPATGG